MRSSVLINSRHCSSFVLNRGILNKKYRFLGISFTVKNSHIYYKSLHYTQVGQRDTLLEKDICQS